MDASYCTPSPLAMISSSLYEGTWILYIALYRLTKKKGGALHICAYEGFLWASFSHWASHLPPWAETQGNQAQAQLGSTQRAAQGR